jgi:hypothetical protein
MATVENKAFLFSRYERRLGGPTECRTDVHFFGSISSGF